MDPKFCERESIPRMRQQAREPTDQGHRSSRTWLEAHKYKGLKGAAPVDAHHLVYPKFKVLDGVLSISLDPCARERDMVSFKIWHFGINDDAKTSN